MSFSRYHDYCHMEMDAHFFEAKLQYLTFGVSFAITYFFPRSSNVYQFSNIINSFLLSDAISESFTSVTYMWPFNIVGSTYFNEEEASQDNIYLGQREGHSQTTELVLKMVPLTLICLSPSLVRYPMIESQCNPVYYLVSMIRIIGYKSIANSEYYIVENNYLLNEYKIHTEIEADFIANYFFPLTAVSFFVSNDLVDQLNMLVFQEATVEFIKGNEFYLANYLHELYPSFLNGNCTAQDILGI